MIAEATALGELPVCHICHRPIQPEDLEADHVQALANGGTDDRLNLKPTHRACNRSKGAGPG